jgi:hypothetical protein
MRNQLVANRLLIETLNEFGAILDARNFHCPDLLPLNTRRRISRSFSSAISR